jgi:hypothetical protein
MAVGDMAAGTRATKARIACQVPSTPLRCASTTTYI